MENFGLFIVCTTLCSVLMLVGGRHLNEELSDARTMVTVASNSTRKVPPVSISHGEIHTDADIPRALPLQAAEPDHSNTETSIKQHTDRDKVGVDKHDNSAISTDDIVKSSNTQQHSTNNVDPFQMNRKHSEKSDVLGITKSSKSVNNVSDLNGLLPDIVSHSETITEDVIVTKHPDRVVTAESNIDSSQETAQIDDVIANDPSETNRVLAAPDETSVIVKPTPELSTSQHLQDDTPELVDVDPNGQGVHSAMALMSTNDESNPGDTHIDTVNQLDDEWGSPAIAPMAVQSMSNSAQERPIFPSEKSKDAANDSADGTESGANSITIDSDNVPLAIIESAHPQEPPQSQKVQITAETDRVITTETRANKPQTNIQANQLGINIDSENEVDPSVSVASNSDTDLNAGSMTGNVVTRAPPPTERIPDDVEPLDIFVDGITYQRFPKPMRLSHMRTKILGKSFKKLYILEESPKKLFQHVRQLEVVYTLEDDMLYANFLFRFIFSRKCEEIERFRLGKVVGNTDLAMFEKELSDGRTERIVFFTERPDDYVYFMSCTDRKVSPYACRDSYYVSLDSARDPPNQFPWETAAVNLKSQMDLTFEDPRFIFNLVLMPCART